VNVKFVKEYPQDVLDMVLVNVMELVLVSLDGRVFLIFLLAVVKLNAQTTVAITDDVIVEFVFVTLVSKVLQIVLVPIHVLIVMVTLNSVVVMENVLAKADIMDSIVKTGPIVVASPIVQPVWHRLIVDGVVMLKSVRTLFSLNGVLMTILC